MQGGLPGFESAAGHGSVTRQSSLKLRIRLVGEEGERSGFPRTGEEDVETRKKGGFMQEEHPKYVPFC